MKVCFEAKRVTESVKRRHWLCRRLDREGQGAHSGSWQGLAVPGGAADWRSHLCLFDRKHCHLPRCQEETLLRRRRPRTRVFRPIKQMALLSNVLARQARPS